MEIRAVYPGSFDPFTLGHEDIVRRAVKVFGEIRILVTHNPKKQSDSDPWERAKLIHEAIQDAGVAPSLAMVDVLDHGLLVDYCTRNDYNLIIKGIRNSADVDYELPMATVNRDLAEIETIYLPASPEVAHISSSLVRQVAALGGDVSRYLPKRIAESFKG
ncbi:MAG: hypothetical protein RLZZ400_108 [Actinomycetota bacterium]|jgi:pantetheine-phosphate adenylyltransferase